MTERKQPPVDNNDVYDVKEKELELTDTRDAAIGEMLEVQPMPGEERKVLFKLDLMYVSLAM